MNKTETKAETKAATTDKPQQQKSKVEQPSKAGYFRWQGLLGFAITLSLVMALLFVYAGNLIKLGIEQGGSWYWGAEINVAEVAVNWSPFKIEISAFEATDAAKPSHNKFAFSRASASIDLWQGLLGKTLIHELVIDAVALDQQRKSQGQVFEQASTKVTPFSQQGAQSLFANSVQALPNADELLQRSDLKTVKAGIKLRQTYQAEQQKISDLVEQLPSKSSISDYKQAIKKITDSKVNTAEQLAALKTQLEQLKNQFKQDKAQVKLAKNQLTQSKTHIATALRQLKQAPAQDWQDISQRYQLNASGAQNITKLLLGQQAGQYHQQAMQVWQKLQPILTKLNKNSSTEPLSAEQQNQPLVRGRYIHFPEQHALPDWLIENARINLQLEQGHFTLQLNEVNAQHWLRNRATTLNMTSQNLLTSGALQLNGTLAISEQSQISADANWQIKQLPLSQFVVHQDEKFALSLAQGELKLDGRFTYDKQQALNSSNQIMLSEAVFAGQADNKLGQLLLDTLSGIDNLAIDLAAKGDLAAPEFSISSDLDQLLGKAIKQGISTSLNKFKTKTQAGLTQKMSQQLNLNQDQAEQLLALDLHFDSLDKSLEQLIESQLGAQLKDKVKDKLLKKLGKLFN
jgi:uncharacterized protein (TIGR03545 family)